MPAAVVDSVEFYPFFERLLAEAARTALCRAASIGRATEPRLCLEGAGLGPNGRRSLPQESKILNRTLPMNPHGPLASLARCSAGQGQALRATAEKAVVLDSALRAARSNSARPGREDAIRPNKKN